MLASETHSPIQLRAAPRQFDRVVQAKLRSLVRVLRLALMLGARPFLAV